MGLRRRRSVLVGFAKELEYMVPPAGQDNLFTNRRVIQSSTPFRLLDRLIAQIQLTALFPSQTSYKLMAGSSPNHGSHHDLLSNFAKYLVLPPIFQIQISSASTQDKRNGSSHTGS